MKTLILFLLSTMLLSAQDNLWKSESWGGDCNQRTYDFINTSGVASDDYVTMQGSAIATKVDDSTGTCNAPTRYMRYGYGELQDSVSGYQKVISSGVIQDTFLVYSQAGSWVSLNGDPNWNADTQDTLYTIFPAPRLEADADTGAINFSAFDLSTGVVDSMVLYKDGVATVFGLNNSEEWGAFSYTITTGHYYKVKAHATYSTRFSDSVYIEPISGVCATYAQPTNLNVIGDTTGCKIVWNKGVCYDSVEVFRATTLTGSYTEIGTVHIDTEFYCDSIPTLTVDTEFYYKLRTFDGANFNLTAADSAVAIYVVSGGGAGENPIVINSHENQGSVTGSTGISITHGFTLANNDVLVAFVGSGEDLGADTMTCSGWTGVYGAWDGTQSDKLISVLYKVITNAAGEPASYTFVDAGNAATDNYAVILVQVRGANTTTVIDSTILGSVGVDDFTPDQADVTTATDSAMVLVCHLASADNTTITGRTGGAPSGFTLLEDIISEVGAGFDILLETAVLENTGAKGLESIGVWTGTADDATSEYMTVAVPIRPAAGSGTLVAFDCAVAGGSPPAQVTGLDTVQINETSILIDWNNLASEDGFKIERKLGGESASSFAQIGTTSTDDIDYTDSPLAENTTYTYRVRAYNSFGNGSYSDTLRVTTDALAGGGSGGFTWDYIVTQGGGGDTLTLDEAISIAAPGDTFYVKGHLSFSSTKIFANSGTAANPIVWRGDIDSVTYWAGASTQFLSTATVLKESTTGSASGITINGNYQRFENMTFYKDHSQNRRLLNLNGNVIRIDSCLVMANDGNAAHGDHTTRTADGDADSLWLQYSRFYRSCRTGIWIGSGGNGQTSDNFLMEYCVLDSMTNHDCIQLMPYTIDSGAVSNNAIIRNCIMRATYGDQAGIYSRHQKNFQYYNNVFITNSVAVNFDTQPSYDSVSSGVNALVAYNTEIYTSTASMNSNKSTDSMDYYNNVVYATNASLDYIYRYEKSILTDGVHPINGHSHNYNCFYWTVGSLTSTSKVIWGTAMTWADYKTTTGFEANSIINDNPDFSTDPTTLTSGELKWWRVQAILTPAVGSPLLNAGTPITTGAGFIRDITTDMFGTARSVTTPDIGAIEVP